MSRSKFRDNKNCSDRGPYVKATMDDSPVSVSAEERDYYYNLDFLCGTYHAHADRFKHYEGPCHGLGCGDEE